MSKRRKLHRHRPTASLPHVERMLALWQQGEADPDVVAPRREFFAFLDDEAKQASKPPA
jgi:hypothetical protein